MSTESSLRISIVTPSFNQGEYIEECILSVINQNYDNLEYIICDGGSTDQTLEIIKKYEKHIHYWRSVKDNGQSAAIREGIQRSTGDIIGWLNADDVYTPDTLKCVVGVLNAATNIDVIYGDTEIIGPSGETIRQMKSVPFCKWGFLTNAFSLCQPSVFWRRKIYEKTAGIDPSQDLVMDQQLWFQFFKAGARFKHIRKILSKFRVHPKSKTMRYQAEMRELFNIARYRMCEIDMTDFRYQLMRRVMRVRTVWHHILSGNIGYLMRDAGKPYLPINEEG